MCIARGFFRCRSGRAGPKGRGQGPRGTKQCAGTGWVGVREKTACVGLFFALIPGV